VRRDIERTKLNDSNHDGHQGALLARMRAVIGAQQAVAAGELGAGYAFRQSLVDLAAAAEAVAAELPAPSIERTREGRRAGWNVGALDRSPISDTSARVPKF
jgi:hypothetical protein